MTIVGPQHGKGGGGNIDTPHRATVRERLASIGTGAIVIAIVVALFASEEAMAARKPACQGGRSRGAAFERHMECAAAGSHQAVLGQPAGRLFRGRRVRAVRRVRGRSWGSFRGGYLSCGHGGRERGRREP